MPIFSSDLVSNGTAKVTGLPAPTVASDAANKGYVDTLVEGLAWKDAVRVASVANINLASPGATIDGVTMTINDRVLVKDQTTQSQNGIYIWNGAATPMTRALDANSVGDLQLAVVTVLSGTSSGSTFRLSTTSFVLDTDPLVWAAFGTAAPAATDTAAGIVELATQAEVNTGADTQRAVTPATLAGYTGFTRKFSQNIGDGSATQYTITHNLNTRDVVTEIYRNSGAFDEIIADVEHATVNTVIVRFASAPSSNQFRVVIVG